MYIFLELLKRPAFRELDFSHVKWFLSGAMPFPVEYLKEFDRTVGEGKLIEVFGMTETNPVTTSLPRYGLKKPGSVLLVTLNVKVWPDSSAGPRESAVAHGLTVWAPAVDRTLSSAPLVNDGASLTAVTSMVKLIPAAWSAIGAMIKWSNGPAVNVIGAVSEIVDALESREANR